MREDVDRLRQRLGVSQVHRKRELEAERVEEELTHQQFQEHVVAEAEEVVYAAQEEEEWGRASFAFTYEWFAKQFLGGAYIDGWIIEQDRRIVRVQANGPGLPFWSESQEAVELAWQATDGPRYGRNVLSVDEVRDEMGYESILYEEDEVEEPKHGWEIFLAMLVLVACVGIVVALLIGSMI